MKITTEWLTKRNACQDQIDTFAREWPEGVVISLAVLKRAAQLQLDLEWFAEWVLTVNFYADYKAKRASLDADYEAKCASLLWKALRKREGEQ
jgi:hypothetical protein